MSQTDEFAASSLIVRQAASGFTGRYRQLIDILARKTSMNYVGVTFRI